jgi:hypothetical protein
MIGSMAVECVGGTVTDLAEFYRLTKNVRKQEKAIKVAREMLKQDYAKLVMICPHFEAADWKSSMRGVGVTRICKICGVEDHASKGGTPGDEYNYGYPGYPDDDFWGHAEIEKVSEKEFYKLRRSHGYRVRNGEVHA